MITPQEALQRVIEHREIFHDEMLEIMRQIMSGQMSPVLISAFITGLRVKMVRTPSSRRTGAACFIAAW